MKKGETFGLNWAKTRNFINFFRKNPLIVENAHKIRPNRASMERFTSKWIILRGKGAQGYAYAQKVWFPSKFSPSPLFTKKSDNFQKISFWKNFQTFAQTIWLRQASWGEGEWLKNFKTIEIISRTWISQNSNITVSRCCKTGKNHYFILGSKNGTHDVIRQKQRYLSSWNTFSSIEYMDITICKKKCSKR